MEEQVKKKKKANPLIKLGILLLAALALFAAWRAMKSANEKKAAAEAARLAAESASQTVTVASFDPAEMTELSYSTPGSTDGTLEILRTRAENEPRLRVASLAQNLHKEGLLKTPVLINVDEAEAAVRKLLYSVTAHTLAGRPVAPSMRGHAAKRIAPVEVSVMV